MRRPPPRQIHRNVKHFLRRGNSVDDAILQRLFSRPAMGLEQHLAGDAAAELESREGADAVEVEAQLDGRHADEAAVGVHDAVVVAEGEGAGAAKGVAG